MKDEGYETVHPHATVNRTRLMTRNAMSAETRLFLCLKDNYGVLLHDPVSGGSSWSVPSQH